MKRADKLIIYMTLLWAPVGCIYQNTGDASKVDGTEWKAVIHPNAQEPNILDAPASLFIPTKVAKARAVLVYCSHALGSFEYKENDWRESAAANDYALLVVQFKADDGNDVAWAFPEQASLLLLQTLDQMAKTSGHDEIRNVPIVTWGHSSGGMLFTTLTSFIPEKTAGIVAYHGAIKDFELEETSEMRDKVLNEEYVKIPILALVGEFDPTWIMSSSDSLVSEGRELGARWAMVIEPNVKHWDAESGRQLEIEFVEEILDKRLKKETSRSESPESLNTIPETDGWLGVVKHHREFDVEDIEGQGHEVIDDAKGYSYDDYPGDPDRAMWLMSGSFAELWLSYMLEE
jgi:hypothetical protein